MLSKNSRFFVLSEVNCWHILYIINECAIYFSIARKSTLFWMMFQEMLLLGIRLVLITCVNHGSNSLLFFLFAKFGAHVKIWTFCVKNSMIIWKKKEKNSKKIQIQAFQNHHISMYMVQLGSKKKLKDV
jgi:hypothetical protein